MKLTILSYTGIIDGNKAILSTYCGNYKVNGMRVYNEILPSKYCKEKREGDGTPIINISAKDYRYCKKHNLIEYDYSKLEDGREYDIIKCLSTGRTWFK